MNGTPSKPWLWIVISLFVLLVVGGMGTVFIASVVAGSAAVGSQVGLVELSGMIMDESRGGVLGSGKSGPRQFIEDLEKAQRDDSIKAVVIRINSPGGSAAASQEMYQAVRRLNKKKPVVCSMGDVAASGGYYVAAACERIYANPATVTGSIGVITQLINVHELIKKYGVTAPTITSGRYKASGNPFQPLDPAQRRLFQELVTSIYKQFVADVDQGRKNLNLAQVLSLADGRVYTGQQAKNNGLIDELGGLHEAVQGAAKLGGITGSVRVKEYSESGLLGSMFSANAQSATSRGVAEVASAVGTAAGQAFADALTKRLKTEGSAPALPQAH